MSAAVVFKRFKQSEGYLTPPYLCWCAGAALLGLWTHRWWVLGFLGTETRNSNRRPVNTAQPGLIWDGANAKLKQISPFISNGNPIAGNPSGEWPKLSACLLKSPLSPLGVKFIDKIKGWVWSNSHFCDLDKIKVLSHFLSSSDLWQNQGLRITLTPEWSVWYTLNPKSWTKVTAPPQPFLPNVCFKLIPVSVSLQDPIFALCICVLGCGCALEPCDSSICVFLWQLCPLCATTSLPCMMRTKSSGMHQTRSSR